MSAEPYGILPVRVALAGALFALAGLTLPGCGDPTAQRSSPPPVPPGRARSLLLVTIDTLRADRLGFAGYDGAETPHLDRLARDGVFFTQARTPVPITLPAHASLFTGLYPTTHGVLDNRPDPLPPAAPLLQEQLLEAGFRTAAFVSGEPLRRGCGLERGFEVYDFAPAPRRLELELAERSSRETVRAALAWARRHASVRERGFLWVHLFDPHAPYTPRAPFSERHRDNPYQGEIAQADDAVGQLLSGLEACGWLEGAAIVVTADHGEGLGEHEEATHGYFLWDTTLRIPLILHGPGIAPGSLVSPRPDLASLVDLPATIADLLGMRDLVTPGSGRSLLDATLPPAPLAYASTWMPYLHFRWSPLRAVCKGRWKLVRAGSNDHVRVEIQGREEEVPEGIGGSAPDLVQALEAFEADLPAAPEGPSRPTLPALPGYLGAGGRYSRRAPTEEGTLEDPHDRTRWIADLRLAQEESARGAYEGALGLLASLGEQDPRNPAVPYWRGRALRGLARTSADPTPFLEAGRKAFHEASRLSGGSTDATNLEAWCLLRLGRLEEAHALLRETIEEGAADAQTHELLGMLLTATAEELGTASNPFLDRDAGAAALEASLRLDPSGTRARRRLEWLREGGKP